MNKGKGTKTNSEDGKRNRTKINEELIMKWVKRKEAGDSYKKIGTDFNCNPATVTKYVKAARDSVPKKRYEAALLSIESENLRTHNWSLVMTAEAVAQCVMVDPEVDPEHPKLSDQLDWRVMLNHYVEQQLLANNDWLIERGTRFRSESGGFDSSWVPDHLITFDSNGEEPVERRLSQLLLRALYEHEPNLKTKVDLWGKEWKAFQKRQRNKKRGNEPARDADEKADGAHSAVKKTALYIRDLVDKMTLYGRPSGDCFLCRASGS